MRWIFLPQNTWGLGPRSTLPGLAICFVQKRQRHPLRALGQISWRRKVKHQDLDESGKLLLMAQLDSIPQTKARADDSWLGVAVVGGVLFALALTILALWLQVVPSAPTSAERFMPLMNGASAVYRITEADGTVHYRSRNVQRAPASQGIGDLSAAAFAALAQAAGIDLETASTAEMLRRLRAVEVAAMTDVEYDANGNTQKRTTQLILLTPSHARVFAVDDIGIAPALPIIAAAPAQETITGTVNAALPFAFTFEQQPLVAATTPLGAWNDCMRVRTTLVFQQDQSVSQTTYCAGVGEVMDETSASGAPQKKYSEIIAASVGSFLRGSAPYIETARRSAEMRNAFPTRLGDALRQAFLYQEKVSSNGITTQIVPLEEFLLYGTASGAIVALDRATLSERWRFQTGGAVYSTPNVTDGIVYFGSADKKTYAVRLTDGAFIWAFPTQDIVSVAVAVSPDTVFVASEDKQVYALDRDTGKVRWTYAMGAPIVAAPTLYENTLFVSNANGELTALNAATGQALWKFATDRAITAPVTVDGEFILVASNDFTVTKLARADGSVTWQTDLNDTVETQPIVADGRVYLALPYELVALDAADGKALWHYRDDRILRGAPMVTGDQLWQLTLTELIGVDAKTGTRFFAVPHFNSPTAGLTGDGQLLYAGFFDGTLLGLEASAP